MIIGITLITLIVLVGLAVIADLYFFNAALKCFLESPATTTEWRSVKWRLYPFTGYWLWRKWRAIT